MSPLPLGTWPETVAQKVDVPTVTGDITLCYLVVGGKDRAKIRKLTLDALSTRQSLVKGERLVRHDMRAVLPTLKPSSVTMEM